MPDSDFFFDRASLEPTTRKDGISALLLVRNGEEFLDLALRSRIDFVDEVIAIPHRCTDRSVQILEKAQNDYPEKIKIYEYTPEVYPPGTELHCITPAHSVHSACNLYNWGMSKTTYKIFSKIDDDDISIESRVERYTAHVRTSLRTNEVLSTYGINMAYDSNQDLGIPLQRPLCGGYDHPYVYIHPERYFEHHDLYEALRMYNTPHWSCMGVSYLHAKHLKQYYGYARLTWSNKYSSKEFRDAAIARIMASDRVCPLQRILERPHLLHAACTPKRVYGDIRGYTGNQQPLRTSIDPLHHALPAQDALEAIKNRVRSIRSMRTGVDDAMYTMPCASTWDKTTLGLRAYYLSLALK